MKIKVFIYGELREACGRDFYELHAATPVKACRLIACQVPAFDRAMRIRSVRVRLGPLGEGRDLYAGQERMRLGRYDEIHITPAGLAASGKNQTLGKVILGVALLGAGLTGGLTLGFGAGLALGGETVLSFGSIALTGASIALTGLAQRLAGNPSVQSYDTREAPEDRPNFLFNGGVNTVNEGPAVAWVFGKDVFVGTNVISAGIINEQIGPGLPEPVVDGLLADFGGSATGEVLNKPKKSKFHPPEESPDSLQSKSIARIVEIAGEGELELVDGLRSVILDGTPVQNEDESINFPGYKLTWRSGLPDQSSIPGMTDIEAFEDVGTTVTFANPVIATVTNADANAARVSLRWGNGLRRVDTSGDIRPTTVKFAIDYRVFGGDWVEVHNVSLPGKAAAGYQLDYRVDLPAGGNPWDLRVRRLMADSNNATTNDEFSFASFTTLIEARLSYPYTAHCMHEIDAKAFGFDIPKRVLRVRRVDVLIPSNYDPDTREYEGFWDGTFKKGCPDNPAWAVRDLQVSKRFGAGDDLDSDLVDDAALYAIAQYNDGMVPNGRGGLEPRYTFNGALSTRQEAYQVFTALAAAFRGMIYWGPGRVTATQDRPKDIAKIVTPANVIGGDITYEGLPLSARHSVVKVTWNDPATQGKPAIAYEADPDLIALFGERQLDIYAWGCIYEGLAHRIARWALETEKNGEVANWQAALDHADLMPGDLAGISDPVISGVQFQGRIKSFDLAANTALLDRSITLADDQTYSITVMGADGKPFETAITDAAGIYTTITLSDSIPSPPPINGAVWAITGSNVAPRQFQVTSNGQTGKMEFTLSADIHDPDKFDRVELEIQLPPRPTSLLPASKPSTPTNLVILEYMRQAGPIVQAAADFGWESTGDTAVRSFEVEYKAPGDEDFRPLGSSLAVTRTVLDITPGSYTFRVRARSAIGIPGDWAEKTQSLLAQQQALADVKQFRGSVAGQQLLLTWSPIDDLRQPPYRIRYSSLTEGATWDQAGELIEQAYGSQAHVPAAAGTYLIKAKTTYAESANAALMVIDIVPNNFNVVETIDEDPVWSGTRSGLTKIGAEIVLPVGNLTGTYQATPPFDLGGVFGFRISTMISATANNPNNVMANWGLLASLASLTGVSADEWSVRMQIRITNDDPNIMPTWSDWADVVPGLYNGRAIDRRLLLSTSNVNVEVHVSAWQTTIDMEDRFEGENDIVSNAAGDAKLFDTPFKAVPRIHITGEDMATGDYWRVTAKSANGFTVRFFNSSNVGISRTYDWSAIGYGIVTASSGGNSMPLGRRSFQTTDFGPHRERRAKAWRTALSASNRERARTLGL